MLTALHASLTSIVFPEQKLIFASNVDHMKSLLTSLLLLCGFVSSGQAVFLDESKRPTIQSNAVYLQTTLDNDSIRTVILKHIKSNYQTIEHYKNGHPTGLWQTKQKNKVISEMDFDSFTYIDSIQPLPDSAMYSDPSFIPPSFPGGASMRLRYLQENINYPQIAKEEGQSGTTYVRFCITREGKITQLAVIKSSYPSLDYESIRVVRAMPDWIPASFKGNPVDSYISMPLKFTLAN